MIWLLLSIASSTLIFAIFKLFAKYNINNLQAIVVNYYVAFAVGFLSGDFEFSVLDLGSKPWSVSIIILGFLFITLFQVMALVSQKFGVSAVSVAVKMSLVIPVLAAVFIYHEDISYLKGIGILCALAAVYLATLKPEKTKGKPAYLFLPIILFVGSGFLDAFINFNQAILVPVGDQAYFASSIFFVAGIFGLIFISYQALMKKVSFQWKNILGGILLGIPNYGSIYFLLQALEIKSLESSVIFPINNVGIVALSVIVGKLFFNEHLSKTNKAGIALALIAILLIAIKSS